MAAKYRTGTALAPRPLLTVEGRRVSVPVTGVALVPGNDDVVLVTFERNARFLGSARERGEFTLLDGAQRRRLAFIAEFPARAGWALLGRCLDAPFDDSASPELSWEAAVADLFDLSATRAALSPTEIFALAAG